jgi:hypothetical protein
MRAAAELGKRLARKRTYTVRVKQSGEYTGAYEHKVGILVDDAEITWFRSPAKASVWNWENAVTTIEWQAGQSVGLTLKHKDSLAADRHVKGALALPALAAGGRILLVRTPKWERYFSGDPYVAVSVDEIGPGQLRLLDNFLDPGSAW